MSRRKHSAETLMAWQEQAARIYAAALPVALEIGAKLEALALSGDVDGTIELFHGQWRQASMDADNASFDMRMMPIGLEYQQTPYGKANTAGGIAIRPDWSPPQLSAELGAIFDRVSPLPAAPTWVPPEVPNDDEGYASRRAFDVHLGEMDRHEWRLATRARQRELFVAAGVAFTLFRMSHMSRGA